MFTPLEVKKRLIKVDKVIDEVTVRRVVVATVTLPIQAIKIFDVVARLTDVVGEVREGGVLVTGVIRKQLFVVDEGDIVRHVPEDVAFREFIELPDARPGLRAQVRARIIDIETQLVTDTEVRQEIVLEIFVKVTKLKQLQVVVDVKGGPKDLVAEKKLLKVDSVVGEDRVTRVIRNQIVLPITAKKIFRIVAEVRDVQAEVRTDVVIVRGVVHKQIFLVDEGDLVRHVPEDVPFTVTVPIQGARPGFDVQVDVQAIVEQFQLVDPPGRRLIQTIMLDIFVKVTEILQIKVVIDVKGTGIEAVKKLLKVEQVVADVIRRTTIESQVELPIGADKIFRIVAEIINVEAEIINGRVIIRAVLHKQIFFVDKGGLLRHFREDVPFQIVLDVPQALPGMNVQPHLRIIGEVDFRLLTKKKVEQVVVVEAFVKITETVQLEVVVDVIWKVPGKPKTNTDIFPPFSEEESE